MKIAVDKGHTLKGYDTSACGIFSESAYDRVLGELIIKMLREAGNEVIDVTVDDGTVFSDMYGSLSARVNKANLNNVDLYISIHFNAGGGQGTEVYLAPRAYYNSDNSYITNLGYAQRVQNNMVALGFRNRGVKTDEFYVLTKSNSHAILIETCFCDTQSDADLYNKLGAERVAKAIVEGVLNKTINISINNDIREFKESDYPMYLFSENWYLERYKNDVAPAVKKGTFKNGYEHYIKHGKNEGRLPVPPVPSDFCEGDYLDLNQDVKKAVDKGSYVSGVHHFMLYGFKESHRKINKGETDEAAKKRVAELELKLEEIKKIVD
ncbi:N-acetylmuramoyl-L-alanine amidase [Clostridium celatum]|uniref:N-acetylmuramoyl-L-alanine amidase n=1 Tax=Clostridium celatum TaxID=36834 RepID=UPI0018974933|nr:N-acetylmuramoyl-L-alanine amidase [Clostridium celatum]